MEDNKQNDVEFLRRLNRHPHLKARMEALLNIAEAAVEAGEMTADEAEIQLREHVREIGRNTLQDWAASKEQFVAEKTKAVNNVKGHGKKNSTGLQHSA